jgi:NitT/TauT family transport system substrate-binding protein
VVGPVRSRRAALLAGIGAAVALSGARANAQTSPLHVVAAITDSNAQAYYAEGGGFFKQAHLSVEITPFTASGAIVAAVAGGAMDIGTGSPLVVVGAREQGVPISIIGPGAVFIESAPTTLLMVAPNSTLRTAADLEGKTIATPSLRGLTEISITAWATRNHADPAKMKYIEMPFAVMPAALERGQIDAAMIAEPALTVARPATREFANPYAAIAKEWYVSAWFVRDDWLAKNRETARAFVQAITKTQVWANSHHSETAQILLSVSKLSEDTVSKMTRSRFATQFDPQLVQRLIDWGAKAGITKGTVSAKDAIARV